MKVGDIVIFTCKGRYAKWFFGKIGEVLKVSVNKENDEYVRVRWFQPVEYFDSHTEFSSFRSDKFQNYQQNL